MSLEIRRVSKDWQHPKDDMGHYLRLFDGPRFVEQAARWDTEAQKWIEGFRSDYKGGWMPLTDDERSMQYESWDGERPDPGNYMPLWAERERTHFMAYENITEGTPVSPKFATAEDLAAWLANNTASWFAGDTFSYDEWLAIINKEQD